MSVTETKGQAEFYRAMDKLLNQPEGTMTGDRMLSNFRQWDARAVLDFMMLAASDFGGDVEPAAIAPCRTVGDLEELVLSRPVASATE